MARRVVDAEKFYDEYEGHRVRDLAVVHERLGRSRPCIWLAGDSSLDSKYYQPALLTHRAVNGYEDVLRPAFSRRDVCYWLNRNRLVAPEYVTINCAVEESTLARRRVRLYPQDKFVRDNIKEEDVLVVSVGGNDVALAPSLGTAWNALKAVFFNSEDALATNPRHSWGMDHFVNLFGQETQTYLEKLLALHKPRKVVVCMIYHPDENTTIRSWASLTLGLLGYNSRPRRLQAFIAALYECATKKIVVEGTEVVPCPLFQALDGKDTSLYVARVEPSESGAKAIAELVAGCIKREARMYEQDAQALSAGPPHVLVDR